MGGYLRRALYGLRLAIGAFIFCGSVAASAVTLRSLEGDAFEPVYGDYAPRGDCSLEPRVTIGRSGLIFRAGGKSTQSSTFEYAASFMGQEYNGISLVFFPFPVSEYEFGHVVMTVNADEKPGVISLEANLGPGERLNGLEAALVKASPLQLCPETAPSHSVQAAERVPQVALKPVKLDWRDLRSLADSRDTYVTNFKEGEIAAVIKAMVGNKVSLLEQNLAVSTPLKRQGSLYYLSGNAPHQGGMEQAYILMDATRRVIQVGLWDRGKLTIYRSSGNSITAPSEIQDLLNQSPPEDALAAPGTPWEIVPTQGGSPLAYVGVAASPNIKSFSLFCSDGRPTLAMLLNKRATGDYHTVSWVFNGGLVDVPVVRGNREGTFWQAILSGSKLQDMLLKQSGSAYLRIDGRMEGEVLLNGSTATIKSVLKPCQNS